jgi:hypothetical protein
MGSQWQLCYLFGHGVYLPLILTHNFFECFYSRLFCFLQTQLFWSAQNKKSAVNQKETHSQRGTHIINRPLSLRCCEGSEVFGVEIIIFHSLIIPNERHSQRAWSYGARIGTACLPADDWHSVSCQYHSSCGLVCMCVCVHSHGGRNKICLITGHSAPLCGRPTCCVMCAILTRGDYADCEGV